MIAYTATTLATAQGDSIESLYRRRVKWEVDALYTGTKAVIQAVEYRVAELKRMAGYVEAWREYIGVQGCVLCLADRPPGDRPDRPIDLAALDLPQYLLLPSGDASMPFAAIDLRDADQPVTDSHGGVLDTDSNLVRAAVRPWQVEPDALERDSGGYERLEAVDGIPTHVGPREFRARMMRAATDWINQQRE